MAQDAWVQYLDRIGRIPLLTRSEVTAAARRVRRGASARRALDGVPPPSADRATELAETVLDGERAKDLLITSNLRLVVSIARHYHAPLLPLSDLVQEGAFGLIRAVEKYDHERGVTFATYASWWIRQAVSRAVAEHARSVRVPKQIGYEIAACVRTRNELAEQLGHEPSAEQVAAALGIDEAQVRVLLRSAAPAHSLQLLGGDLGAVRDGAVPPDDLAQRRVEQDELRARLDAALLRLPTTHRAVLRDRVGWSDGCPRSLRTVARAHGLSRDVVRRLESEAWEMLRQLPQLNGLRDWLEA